MNAAQLARALMQGIGRPHVHVRRSGRLDHPEVVLHACLTNPIYDRQCSGTRAAYLQELIELSGEQRWFRERILAALADPDEEVDEAQLREFAMGYVRAGDAEARQVFYERVAADAADGYIASVCDLIDLDGPRAALQVVDQLGELALTSPEDLDDDYLLDYIEREHGAETLAELLEVARARGAFARAYVNHALAARAAEHAADAARPQITGPRYRDLLDYLDRAERASPGQVGIWATRAARADLRLAARGLLEAESDDRLLAHIQVFCRRRFPYSPKHLMPYVRHPNERIARRSLVALEDLCHPALRPLALELIAAGRLVDLALGLFIANYQPGDEALFRRLLDGAADDEAAHGIILSLNDVYAANPTPAAADLLLAMYERGPCALCRTHTVKALLAIDALPDGLREECRHDADKGTRALVGA